MKRGANKKDDHREEKRSSKKVEFLDGPEELDLDDEQNDDSDVDIQVLRFCSALKSNEISIIRS